MKRIRIKLLLAIFLLSLVAFLTNDFGLIDIEKTSIITAIAIDKSGDEYTVTAQVAVPEATDQNSENQKAVISANGKTIGFAIKRLGNLTGWFPKLSFCNLIILGDEVVNQDVISILDYFAKTLKVQDSSLVVMAEKKGQELLELTSPLDNISSFAIQKILLKNPGLDKDVSTIDLKTFVASYYSKTASGYMPIIKVVEDVEGIPDNSADSGGSSSSGSQGGSSSSGGSSGGGQNSSSGGGSSGTNGSSQGGSSDEQGKGHTVFDATSTALFYKGVKVGELTPRQTVAFNVLNNEVMETAFEVSFPPSADVNEQIYLITMLSSNSKKDIEIKDGNLYLNVNVDIYCKISDSTVVDYNQPLVSDSPLPLRIKSKAEQIIQNSVEEVIQKERDTNCDILGIKEHLYRYLTPYYSMLKDTATQKIISTVKVNVTSSK